MAHLIELCTLVYPQTFGPKLADDFEHWSGIVLERMRADVGDLYPAVQVPATEDVAKQAELFGGGGDPPLTVGQIDPVASIWVRTVPCRRPGCTAPVPLVLQAWLRRKGGVVAAVPEIEDGDRLGWRIVSGAAARDVSGQEEQTGAGQAVCVACHAPAPADHVKEMAVAGRMEESLTAIVGALPPKPPVEPAPVPDAVAVGRAFVDANPGFHYLRVMHTAAATLPEDAARCLRIRVAGDRRSGSGWLVGLFEGVRQRGDTHETGMERRLARKPHTAKRMGEGNTNESDEIHR